MKDAKAKIDALKGIAKMMSKLELDRVKGYKKVSPEPEGEDEDEEDDDELMKVLDARAMKK